MELKWDYQGISRAEWVKAKTHFDTQPGEPAKLASLALGRMIYEEDEFSRQDQGYYS